MNLSQSLITGENIQLGEALSQGLSVTGLGLLIVFSVLVTLMIVLYLFKVIFYKKPGEAVTTAAPATEEIVEETDEGELIAVLTAAIAASLNTSTYNLKIKSYRRVNNTAPAWNKAGVTETLNNRL